MASIAMTGSNGFLGFHTRAAAQEYGDSISRIAVGQNFDLDAAVQTMNDADTLLHVAGVNRGTESEIEDGNIGFAASLAEALRMSANPPKRIVYANSIQSGRGSVYGDTKAKAGQILADVASEIGSKYFDAHLPNLFGEFGRPYYNSVTATFCHQVAAGELPSVQSDNEIPLLHVQNAADLLLGNITSQEMRELTTPIGVRVLARRIKELADVYRDGTIPAITSAFDRDLFNTYRSFLFPKHSPIPLVRHADDRGSFFEIIRSRGGEAQTSFSTTAPEITRGDHFHRRKIERFTVLSGRARISLRKIFDDKIYTFQVAGDNPVAIDMPTMFAHNITNTGPDTLYTMFWANEVFDPQSPDTIPHEV